MIAHERVQRFPYAAAEAELFFLLLFIVYEARSYLIHPFCVTTHEQQQRPSHSLKYLFTRAHLIHIHTETLVINTFARRSTVYTFDHLLRLNMRFSWWNPLNFRFISEFSECTQD